MIVVDEYVVTRVAVGEWPDALPDSEDLLLPLSRHWRLLQRIHAPSSGQLSTILAGLTTAVRDGIRFPRSDLFQVLDSRTVLDEAAQIAARYGGGWLITETLAAGLANGQKLWFGRSNNVGRVITAAAEELGIDVHVV